MLSKCGLLCVVAPIFAVLILVLMEYALEEFSKFRGQSTRERVLILVLMEYALEAGDSFKSVVFTKS